MTGSGRIPESGPTEFDKTYSLMAGFWRNPDASAIDRAARAIRMMGGIDGKSILDLGGGPLLCRFAEKAKRFVLVDWSEEACRLAREVAPWAEVLCQDAWTHLRNYDRKLPLPFDVTVAMGIAEYGPKDGLDMLFRLAPSRNLVLYTPIHAGYLELPLRTWMPDRGDIDHLEKAHGWEMIGDEPSSEHVFRTWRKR